MCGAFQCGQTDARLCTYTISLYQTNLRGSLSCDADFWVSDGLTPGGGYLFCVLKPKYDTARSQHLYTDLWWMFLLNMIEKFVGNGGAIMKRYAIRCRRCQPDTKKEKKRPNWYDIFVNCSWEASRWQQYSTHLHTDSTQNDKQHTEQHH